MTPWRIAGDIGCLFQSTCPCAQRRSEIKLGCFDAVFWLMDLMLFSRHFMQGFVRVRKFVRHIKLEFVKLPLNSQN